MIKIIIALIVLTLIGHCLCAAYLVNKQKKAGKPAGMWLLTALFLGLIALVYYHRDNNKQD